MIRTRALASTRSSCLSLGHASSNAQVYLAEAFLVCKPLLACSLSQIDITRLARDFARFVDFEIEER